MSKTHRSPRSRLLVILLTPVVLISILTFALTMVHIDQNLNTQTSRYGESTVSQIAYHLSEYVVNEDLLSLNVLVAKLQSMGQIQSLEVYDSTNQLLAQAGREQAGAMSFSREMSVQDSTVGYVRITTAATESSEQLLGALSIALLAGAVLIFIIVWKYGDLLVQWVVNTSPFLQTDNLGTDNLSSFPVCVLVVKIRPARHLRIYRDQFVSAIRLYHGEPDQVTGDELTITFSGPDAVFLGVCSGLLILNLAELASSSIDFGAAIDLLDNPDSDKARKNASYLASIASGQLLITDAAMPGKGFTQRVELEPFQHSLIDDKDIYSTERLVNQELLSQQALQLSSMTSLQ